MEYPIRDKIEYIIALVDEFAKKFSLTAKQAYHYLQFYKGIELIIKHYGILHTLSFEDALENLEIYCRKNGGSL